MTKPTGRVEVNTERLLLRPFKLEDVDDVFEYARDPEYGRYLFLPQQYTRMHAEMFLARQLLESWDTRPVFAIVRDSRVVGGIGLRIDVAHETGALGYAIARSQWGKGLVPEAGRAIVDWGFKGHGLARIYAPADLRNIRSQRVMEKLGMTREGVLRSHRKERGERTDEVYYGILREEWEQGAGTPPNE